MGDGRWTLKSFAEIRTEKRRSDWGPWQLDKETYVLYVGDPYRYEVDLERCTTSAEVLDWVCQIAGKGWANDKVLAGLVRALNEVLTPQTNLCLSGRHLTLTRAKIRKLVR